MVARIDPAHALVTVPPAWLPAQGGSVLSLASGDIAAELRRVGRSRGGNAYELRVVNDSAETVTAYAYPVPVGAGARAWQGALVPAFSSIAVRVDAPPGSGGAPLVAELHAGGTRLGIGAPPARRTAPRLRAWLSGALAGTLIVLAAILHDGGPAAQPVAHANAPALTSTSASRLAKAAVPHGAISARSHPGSAGAPLRIDAVRAPGSAQSGQSVRIDYRTQGSSGTVALIDEFGKTVARTALDPTGSSVLLVPNIAVAQDFEIVIGARRGRELASADVPIFVRPAPHRQSKPQPRTDAARQQSSRAQAPSNQSGTFAAGNMNVAPATEDQIDATVVAHDVSAPVVAAPVQRVGLPIVVRVLAHPRALHLTLYASGGTPLGERDVPRDAGRVLFPPLSQPRDLSLIATYGDGQGEESTISTLAVK